MSKRRKVFIECILVIGLLAVAVGTLHYREFGPSDQTLTHLLIIAVFQFLQNWWFAIIALIIAVVFGIKRERRRRL